MIEFHPADMDPREVYFLLTAAVVPRPIAWVSTVSASGVRNLAPHSYYNACSTNPPIVHFTQSRDKDSSRNAAETGEFVVNVVSHELGPPMRITAGEFPPEEDEFVWADLEAADSVVVRPPRVATALIALECRLRQIITMGEGRMVFGDVVHIHVAEQVWRDGRIDFEALRPVGRLGASNYVSVTDVYRLDLPEEIAAVVGDHRRRFAEGPIKTNLDP